MKIDPIINSCPDNLYNKVVNEAASKVNEKGLTFGEVNKSFDYLQRLKDELPNYKVEVKSMNTKDVDEFYNKWKQNPAVSNSLRQLTISPKVLEKMQKDENYANQMMAKIKDASVPTGFKELGIELCEYRVIVKDDGEIEILASGVQENKKVNHKDDYDEKKNKEKKLRKIKDLEYRRLKYEQEKLAQKEAAQRAWNTEIQYQNYLNQHAQILKTAGSIKNNDK